MKCLRHIIFAFLFSPFFCSAQSNTNLWAVRLSEFICHSSPAIAADGTIYVGSFDGNLFAVSPDGQVKWKFKTPMEIKSSPAVGADGTIYFGSRDRKLYAVTPAGDLKWTFTTGAWVDSSPAITADGTICFGSWDTNFYALNPDGSLKWTFPSGGIIDSSPAIATNGTIYFGSHDKYFYALSPDGKLRWRFLTQAPITSSPAIAADGDVYFSSTDGNFYALNSTGTEKWLYHTGGVSEASPVLGINNDIYVIFYRTNGGHMGSFSPTGIRNWDWTTENTWNDTTPAVLANGDIYFFWPPQMFVGVLPSQPIIEIIKPGDNISSSPVVTTNGVFYFTSGRDLVAVAPTNSAPLAKSSWPMFRGNPQHTGRVAVP
ncbi:MAG TPA: PQQ-binding-like beta-propeller repeat protein [Verrucomicrobiae bacterium]